MADDTASYAEETITFTTEASDDQATIKVTLYVTYDTTQTAKEKRQGYYEIKSVTGTYEVIKDGTVAETYEVTKLVSKDMIGDNDNRLYLDSSDVSTIVDRHGLSFEISDPTTDRPHRTEHLNLSEDSKGYRLYSDRYDKKVASLTTSSSSTSSSTTEAAEAAACFVSGTRLATKHGDIAVEKLKIGDLVLTTSGKLRPIRWLGHRTIDCRRRPDSEAVMPICIAAHAFGDDQPSRNLYLSPGHAVCVDVMGEILIPIGALVNGATIWQEPVARVTYWHVELDSHDIVLAENLPAETYLDMGNRAFFAEAKTVALHAGADGSVVPHLSFCRPLVGGGPLNELVRNYLKSQPGRPGATQQ